MKAHPQHVVDRCRRLSQIHTQADVAAITGVNLNTLRHMRLRGWVAATSQARPAPSDFAIQCQHMTVQELRAHYGVGIRAIYRWLAGVERHYTPRPNPLWMTLPPKREVAEAVARYGVVGAARHFGVHEDTLLHWRRKLGLHVPQTGGSLRSNLIKRMADLKSTRMAAVERVA